MSPARSTRFCFLLLAGFIAGSSGCREPERPPIIWGGDHVQVGTDLDLNNWCPGTLPLLDSHVRLLKEVFDVPADHVVTYYLYPPPITDYACPEFEGFVTGACFLPDERAVFATDLFDLHEIVHAVQWAHGGMPHVFSEGAATYWGGGGDPDALGLEIRALLDDAWSGRLGSRGYSLAAKFTAYLIHVNGPEPYAELLKATSWNQSRPDFEKVFEQAMGMTLDDAIADYATNTDWWYCNVAATQYWFYACSNPGLVLPPGGETYFDLDISCADPKVAGPSSRVSIDGTPRLWTDITVEFDGMNQIFEFDTPMGGESSSVLVEIKSCATDCSLVQDSTKRWNPGLDGDDFFTSVLPGRNVVRVSRAADDPGPVRFRWFQPGS